MSLLTVTLKIVSPQGRDDTPYNSSGMVEFIPVAHGKYQHNLRTIEKITSPFANGVMVPVELTPAMWNVTIKPTKGYPWPSMTFNLVEGMEEPVNLANLVPEDDYTDPGLSTKYNELYDKVQELVTRVEELESHLDRT